MLILLLGALAVGMAALIALAVLANCAASRDLEWEPLEW